MKAYKGFDKNLQCTPGGKPFQFEIGNTYTEDQAALCKKGFHACLSPYDVFKYYPSSCSRYCEVELDDVSDERKPEDSQVCAKTITIVKELNLAEFVNAGVEYIKKIAEGTSNTGNWSTVTTTGDRSTAANTGNCSTVTTTGDRSTAANAGNWSTVTTTGNWSTATATGNWSTATTIGDWSTAAASGIKSVAIALGTEGMAKGATGGWIICAEWEQDTQYNWHRTDVQTVKVDGEIIKPDTFYRLKNGKFVEVS